jgi:hypothetical protein
MFKTILALSFVTVKAQNQQKDRTQEFLDMPEVNDRPIIGIVTNGIQDLFEGEDEARAKGYTSVMSRNYV